MRALIIIVINAAQWGKCCCNGRFTPDLIRDYIRGSDDVIAATAAAALAATLSLPFRHILDTHIMYIRVEENCFFFRLYIYI